MRHRAPTRRAPIRRALQARGFTLVEILVVITIIAILAGLLIPAIGIVIERGKIGRIKMEIANLQMATEAYHNKYGDYPPDFSDWNVVTRHFRSAFPRMAAGEITLLTNLTHSGSPAVFNPAGIDRAEALVLTLGGYSSDPVHPLTGPGGPLEFIGTATDSPTDPDYYQYRADRDNAFFTFDVSRMTMTPMDANKSLSPTNKLSSTDEGDFGTGPWADPLPAYRPAESVAPYVYFESRTYGYLASSGAFNGYGPQSSGLATSEIGAVRPYKTNRPNPNTSGGYSDLADASGAFDFMNAKTFQIISAGPDNRFGTIVGTDDTTPVYFLFPTGEAMLVSASASNPGDMTSGGSNGYQENSLNTSIMDNSHYDNVTNFSEGKLEDEIEE